MKNGLIKLNRSVKNNCKNIRVAHVVGKMNGGGVEAFLLNFQKGLCKYGIYFDYIVDSDSKHVPYNEILKYGGRVFFVPPYSKVISYCKVLHKLILEHKWKIIHCHLNTLSIFPLAVAFFSKVPVRISHCHGTASPFFSEFFKNIIKYSLRPFAKAYANVYWACGKRAGEWLFGKETKFSIINNAIDLSKFYFRNDERSCIRNNLNLNNNEKVIGHVGRFEKVKNQLYIIDVVDLLIKRGNNIKCIFCGDGVEFENIRNIIKNRGLNRFFIFMGYSKTISEVYNCFDIFVFPSLYEGLGIALIEAQQNGLYCIASKGVPIETNISNRVFYYNIGKSNIINWVEKIENICSQNYSRKVEKMKEYDIVYWSMIVARNYTELINEYDKKTNILKKAKKVKMKV